MLTEHNARLEFDRTDIDDFGDELIEALSLDPPMGGVARWAREHENAPLNWEDTTW